MLGLKRRRRTRLRAEGLDAGRRAIVERNVPAFHHLPEPDRRELLGHTRVLLEEKRFEGLGGLDMTDEIRVTIAAQAALLLLHRERPTYFPSVKSILVYPHAYVVPTKQVGPGGMVTEGNQVRLGESWTRGNVVLSWRDALHGALDAGDGHNLVLHEFAHQLDSEWGGMEGAPELTRKGCMASWARVLGDEYKNLRRAAIHGHDTLLNRYGATNPAEFFAVVTEAFFEQPRAMKAHHPDLYHQLSCFYNQDPAAWDR
jgi:Mlc titration factor MtfA (ptsG expression regulator)